ncbi:MAG: ArsR/SmtB family transcription factor [Myxococcales bacterium]
MLDQVFSALADPTRRRILRRLSRGPASVGELARPFRISLPAISRHLRVLEQAGLLRSERYGKGRRCTLQPRALEPAARYIEETRAFWEGALAQLADYLEGSK